MWQKAMAPALQARSFASPEGQKLDNQRSFFSAQPIKDDNPGVQNNVKKPLFDLKTVRTHTIYISCYTAGPQAILTHKLW